MASPALVTAAPETLRVLVVDDNASLLRFLVSAFSANGCIVSQAAAAEQALSVIAAEAFDLVVSDIKMPGLSGLDLLRAVKARQPGTPVVLITGNPSINSAVSSRPASAMFRRHASHFAWSFSSERTRPPR